tara:strand:+ start:600 stop:887 length:288 start_codon:yes stop_codon:yes gene_type:complete
MTQKSYNEWRAMAKSKAPRQYQITGTLRNGKRFSPFNTTMPANYNIWSGTVWEIMPNGKRVMVQRIAPGGVTWWRRSQNTGEVLKFNSKTGRWGR